MFPTLNPATAGSGLPLADYVALAARHGFSGVEFSVHQVAELGFEKASAIFEGHKILPAVFGLPVEWRKDETTFQNGLKNLSKLAELAEKLDCTRCTTYVLPASDDPDYPSRSLERFIQIADVLSEQGVRFGLEFIGPHHFRKPPEKVWFYDILGALEVVEQIHAQSRVRNCGLLVDCFHWHTAQNSAMDLAAIPLEEIVHVHINDAPANLAVEEIHDSVRELPGATGTIDLTAFLTTLNNLGYDGPVAVETFSENLKKMTPDEAAEAASRAIGASFRAAHVEPLRLL